MSHPVKHLTQEKVQEIFTELRKLHAMAHELGQDAERGSREVAAKPTDQFLRRNQVRIFAAYVEGLSHVIKQGVLRLHEPLQVPLSNEEPSKLKDQRLDQSGQLKESRLSIAENLKFAFAVFAKLTGSSYRLSCGTAGHQAFNRTIAVRDRLMHPKFIEALCVQDKEAQDLQVAWLWHQSQVCSLLNDSIARLNQRFADIPQPSGEASGRLPKATSQATTGID